MAAATAMLCELTNATRSTSRLVRGVGVRLRRTSTSLRNYTSGSDRPREFACTTFRPLWQTQRAPTSKLLTIKRLSSTSNLSTEPAIHHTVQEHSPNNEIATITVSNPSKLNIVNSALLDQLIKTCTTLSQNPSLRAVILQGGPTAEGKQPSFIGGADIREMNSLSSSTEARDFITKVHSTCQAFRDIPVPVIAKIDGLCLGAGLEIAVSCDLRIATEKSTFAMPEVRIGIPSVAEAALIPGLVGFGRARRLLYLAETIGARQAQRWGLVDRFAKDEGALEKGVKEWTGTICEMGPKAMRAQKKLMLGWENQTAEEGIQAGLEAFAETYEDGGEEPKEYMGRFVNRKR